MIGWKQAAALASAIEDRMESLRAGGELAAAFPRPPAAGRRRAGSGAGRRDRCGRADGGGAGEPRRARQAKAKRASSRRGGEARRRADAAPAPSPESSPTIRVAAGKVDRMLDAVGETVLYHRRLEHSLGDTLRDGRQASDELDTGEQLLDELQDSVIQMRTLPLSTITASFPRAIRDLATDEKKEVELSVSGDETQLDRVILDRHLGDHRPPPPQRRRPRDRDPERARSGEEGPACGRVELRAEPRGRMVAIQVVDDGRGVSPELAARAREGGLAGRDPRRDRVLDRRAGHRGRRPRGRP